VDEAAAVRRIPVGDHGNGAAVDSIESAFYGSADGTIRGADVTDSLKALVTRCFGARSRVGAAEGEDPNTVWLQPSDTFNCSVSVPERADPAPGQGKRLVVTVSCGGHNKEISALEHETLGLTLSSIFADKLASSSAGDRQVTLEDGAVLTYRWYKFIEQPAMQQLQKEHPEFYTTAELARVQAIVEKMHRSWQSKPGLSSQDREPFLPHSHKQLVKIEEALFVEPPSYGSVGYVPVAIGLEYPPEAEPIHTHTYQGKRW